MTWDQLVLKKQIAQERHRNTILQTSLSWKIAKPLRFHHDMIHKVQS
jgi:hypothetical protein